MEVTKFEGIDRGLIKVWFGEKSILITGELTMTPKFYADIISIKKWESPFEDEIITDEVKKEIIHSIERFTRTAKVKVIFD